jgi:4-hydroxyphenylpyruvate dioxygenase
MTEQNPIGIKAIDHLEFTCDTLTTPTKKTFYDLGFECTHKSQESQQELFSQGQIRFLLNANTDPNSHARKYFKAHGEGVSKISFQVENAEMAIETALKRGAQLHADLNVVETEKGLVKKAAIKGFGDVINEFVEKPLGIFRDGFKEITNDQTAKPLKVRVSRIDHFTNNVPKGEMDHWADFYGRIYGMKQTRYFDIKGVKTGLNSKVMQLSNNQVIIPINEPEVEGGKSQIQEFLDLHKGAGVQHIALMTPDIITTVAELRERAVRFLKVPATYYQDIPKRGLNVTEDLKTLEKINLLVDGDKEGYLLQIFSETYVGPLFFEYIQRKNHWGFGEGNFQALFDAIERDQMERGYL